MKRALVLSFSNLKTDARVTRQIYFLKEQFQVTALCYDAYSSDDYEIYKINKTKLGFLRKAISSIFLILGLNHIAYYILNHYQQHIPILRERKFDLIIANDVETLPISFQVADGKSKIFFDAHEYAPRQFEDRLYWRIFFQRYTMALCKLYIPQVDGMSTINHGIADAYEKKFGIKPIIITNAANYFDLKPQEKFDYPIKIVHHGIFNLSRSPDIMIDLFKMLDDRFTLDLIYMLPESSSAKTRAYFEEFKSKAQQVEKIKILPALKSSEIVPFLYGKYDIGIILVPPVNFNYENGLPNKLFDCIQARMGMAVGPLREIANITTQFNIGVVSKEFTAESMFEALHTLTIADINQFKKNSHIAAHKMNSEQNKVLFLQKLSEIMSS